MKTLNKQKIAVLGSGLTANAVALALSSLNLNIDLIQEKLTPKKLSNATLSISDASFKILENIGIRKNSSVFWPVKKITLFDNGNNQSQPDTEFYNIDQKKYLSYIVKKNNLEKLITKKLTNINVIKNKVSSIEDKGFLKKIIFKNKKQLEYNLIIATEFEYLKLLSNEEKFNWNYSETAYTFLIYHTKIDNHCARQFFLEDGPLAFLPISNTTTSVVWSVQNNSKAEKIIHNVKDRLNFLRNISSNFYQINTCSKDLDYFPLTFEFLKKTVLSRTIFLGDITHKIHPIAGQGWNMTLRDIDILVKDLKYNINKGYDIGDINLLKEFEKKTKTSNLLFAVSIDLIRKSFRAQSPAISSLRKKSFSLASQPEIMSKIINIADKGLRI